MSRLFYKTEAGQDWNRALPIGNGRLGAMLYGNAGTERIQLNEDSLWYGSAMNRINPDARENLPLVRSLILEGKIKEAEEVMVHSFTGTPESERTYATLGELQLRYLSIDGTSVKDYERELSLDDAVFRLKKTYKGVTYRENAFASFPANLIAVSVETDGDVPFDLDIKYDRMCFYDSSFHDNTTVYSLGSMVGDGYRYVAGLTAVSDSGEITPVGEYLVCRNVTKLRLYVTAVTTFYEKDPLSEVRYILNKARATEYDELLTEHIEDYRSLFERTAFEFTYDKDLDLIPTDERLKLFSKDSPDNGLLKTYFDFGRYLLISCSRPGSLPANLQGIWNPHMNPPWGSKFTININTEMNYWPAEMLGLGDCHLPLFDLIRRMGDNGRRTAREMYGCRGTVAHHNTDLWGDTAPQDTWIPATYWVMGMAWLCTHIMLHYRYTLDRVFLSEMYPVMRETVLFFHDFLYEKDGKLILCPSLSPENTYRLKNGQTGHACYNSTMDLEILTDLFQGFLEASEIVEDGDDAFIAETKRLLALIPPIRIGRHGQIMEWCEDYEEEEPGHRHISHLYALHPAALIRPERDPELFKAASVTLKRRLQYGGGHTGWSRAWIMNLYARLKDGEKLYENLIALLKRSTLDNLFDNHPPFQIDGNFGAISAVGESFLYCDEDGVELMPAPIPAFTDGFFKGIRARNGAVYDLFLEGGTLTRFVVHAERADYRSEVRYAGKTFTVSLKKGETAEYLLKGQH